MDDVPALSTDGGCSTPGQQASRITDQDTATAPKQLTCASVHQELTQEVADASTFRQYCEDELAEAEKALSLAHSSFNGEWHGPRTIVDYALTYPRETEKEWRGRRDKAVEFERKAKEGLDSHVKDHGPNSRWETDPSVLCDKKRTSGDAVTDQTL